MAVSFLTRVPTGVVIEDEPALARGVKWFPVVGLVIGLLGGGAFVAASRVSVWVAAIAAVATTVAVTGAFHEDGLADTFDGLSSGRTVTGQLEIMRDPRIGTFGTVALVLVLGLRVGLLAELESGWPAVLALAWAHGASRSAAVGVMVVARPARPGLGESHLSNLRRVPATLLAAGVVAIGWWLVPGSLPAATLGLVVGPALLVVWAHRRIGGVTGDVLGACQQAALVGALVGIVA